MIQVIRRAVVAQGIFALVCAASVATAPPLEAREVAPGAGLEETLQSEINTPSDVIVSIYLKDGTVLVGRIVKQDETELRVVTASGADVLVPRSAVDRVEPQRPALPGGFRRQDPNHTRLLFAPTGRPLGRGEGQFTDHYVLFPGVSYGLTDNLSIMGGVSIVPGLGLGEQLFYVAPRVAFTISARSAVSAGLLYATGGEGADRFGAGIVFAVGTFGDRQASLSVGGGLGFVRDHGEIEWASKPILMLGGEYQLSNSLALISENWLILGDGFGFGEQPFGLAFRLFGDRLSVDAGVLLIGNVLKEGFPIPWLSFSYRFGRAETARSPSAMRSSFTPPPLRPQR